MLPKHCFRVARACLQRQTPIPRNLTPFITATRSPLLFSTPRSNLQFEQLRFAGHNKWSKVKHTKGAKDAKRGKLFSKISLEIISSIKAGGADPGVNGRLAAALNKAKHAMMPKDSVDAAIKKAASKSSSDTLEDVIYEGYGPGGVAMIIETVTDKRARTIKEVKEILNRLGGSISTVSWMFEKKGRIQFRAGQKGSSVEDMMDSAIDAGAEDMQELEDESIEVICEFTNLNAVTQKIKEQGYEVDEMAAAYVPTTTVEVTDDETQELVEKCLGEIEDLDDVVKVHFNGVLPEK
ncbi:transcriptional regulator-domain-containing protein [Umbelopsis sp. PMI_123]|nr:transcriptional regulator-domain-containing protein [Umbelopsis sp. PMI_123]